MPDDLTPAAAGSAEVQEAVFELQQYLADRLPPLMVADSVALLVRQPPSLLTAEIGVWVAHQRPAVPDLSVADLLFHAAKKIAMMGELNLVPQAVIGQGLAGLVEPLVAQCPEEDRELLRQNLERLRHSSLAAAAPEAVPILDHQPGAEAAQKAREKASTPGLTPAASRGLRRLSLFLERLQAPAASGAAGTPAASAPPPQNSEVASQFMTAAAVQSSTAKELEEQLAPLRQFGIDTDPNQVVRALAPAAPGAQAPLVGLQLNAMRQIVSLAEAPEEAAKRFRELVHAAIEQFNEGNLGRAVTMFELAEQLAAEQKVKPVFLEALRKSGGEYLDPERLRRFAERGEARPALRVIMNFFDALRPDGLLLQLDREPRRERRYQLLAMLEAHDTSARAKAWELLKASVDTPGSEVDAFFQGNLI